MSAKADRLHDLIIHCNSKAEHAAGGEMRALWLNLRDSYRLLLRVERNADSPSVAPATLRDRDAL
jgi:hypothetical protein